MTTHSANHNADNERIKRRYFAYLKEAKRHSEATVDAVAKALARFEADTADNKGRPRDFKAFHFEQAIAFKKRLTVQKAQRSGEKLSKATLNATLAHVKRFFHWLAGQPGFKSRLQYSDADYFNLSEKDVRVATARREQVGPTVEQVKHVIAMMPAESAIQRRDRALVAFTLLTGARDSAIASMKLKHVNLAAGCVEQDVRLSAFNLTLQLNLKRVSVEVAFQADKRFERGGPFLDLLDRTSREAKKDPRLKESGRLVEFVLSGESWPLEPQTAFYDWIYLQALATDPELTEKLTAYEAFTYIEFNPEKSINCQARSAALYVSLHRAGLIKSALSSKAVYLKILGGGASETGQQGLF